MPGKGMVVPQASALGNQVPRNNKLYAGQVVYGVMFLPASDSKQLKTEEGSCYHLTSLITMLKL